MKNLVNLFLFFSFIISVSAQSDSLFYSTHHPSNLALDRHNLSLITGENNTIYMVHEFAHTLFLSISSDEGKNWNFIEPEMDLNFKLIDIKDGRSVLSAIRLDDGNFLALWLEKNNKIGYARTTNSTPLVFSQYSSIYGSNSSSIQLTLTANGDLLIALGDNEGNVKFYKTDPESINLDSLHFIESNSKLNTELNIINTADQNLLAFYTSDDSTSISYVQFRKSTDNGETWSELSVISNSLQKDIKNIRTIRKSNGDIFVFYEIENQIPFEDRYYGNRKVVNDIYYYKTTDEGTSWTNNRVTNYVGNDLLKGVCEINGNLIASLESNREGSYNSPFGKYFLYPEYFVDPSPPNIFQVDFLNVSENSPFIVNAYIDDFENMPNGGIAEVYMLLNYADSINLYDDGQHSDQNANDNIWGNVIQTIDNSNPRETQLLHTNNIFMPFSNNGIIAEENSTILDTKTELHVVDNSHNRRIRRSNITLDDEPSGFGGRYDDITFLYSAGFLLSGKKADETIWANGACSSNLFEDYLPGKVGSNPDNPINKIYVVKRSDAEFGSSWQYWSDAVELGANFYDGDNDGLYNPVDKNSNGQWDSVEDKPDLLYDATYFTTYNDSKPADERRLGAEPLGLEVNQTVFASSQNTILDDVVFVRYKITNTGEPLNDIYFTIYADGDIGDYQDDTFGSDTSLNSSYFYNNTYDEEYGVNAPAFFTTILQGPIIESLGSTATINRGPELGQQTFPDHKNLGMTASSVAVRPLPNLPPPYDSLEVFNYARGFLYNGAVPDPCDFYYSEFIGGGCENTNPYFWFSGDPVTKTGWLNIQSYDIRGFTSSGPFNLGQDETSEIVVAYIVGRGADSLQSVTRAREITQYVHEEYDRNFSTIVGVNDEKEEVVNVFSLSQNYPNPFNPTTTIEYTITGNPPVSSPSVKGRTKEGFVSLVVYNILGQKVKTLVNEAKAPGNYKVTFDASQLSSGVYFYRLESGSFIQTKKMMLLK